MKPHGTKSLDPTQRRQMLNELESLSDMLDAEEEEERPRFDDLPVLKSFVEDVPVLNDRVNHERINNNPINPGKADTSFIDNDPLAISDAVRRQRQGGAEPVPAPAPVTPPAAARPKSDYERFKEQHFEDPALTQRASLDKLRETKNDAAEELRRLLNTPGGKPRFDKDPSSREYQQLRQKATQVVNEIIKSYLPRLEAELRMRLETEVDRIIKDSK